MTYKSGKEVVKVWHCYGIIMVQSQPGESIYLAGSPSPTHSPIVSRGT